MRKILFLTLITIFTLTACTPAAAPAPTTTPTDLPPTATATAAPTVTSEPTAIPHPEGWEETWEVVEGYWMSPDMAAYVEKQDGHLEEIDGKNYFTTMVTVTIDDQTQDVKVKLLEESGDRVMIPSYETVQELLGQNKVREVLELSRMKHAEDALFVVRSGEIMDSDLQRTREVVRAFMDRVNAERGTNIWPLLGFMNNSLINEEGQSIFPTNAYTLTFIPDLDSAQIESELTNNNHTPSSRMYLITHILGTDSIVGFVPSSNAGIVNVGIDQSVMMSTVLDNGVYNSNEYYRGYSSFSALIDDFLCLDVVMAHMQIETPVFWEDPFSTLTKERQREWSNGPVVFYDQLSESEKYFVRDAMNKQRVFDELGDIPLVMQGKIVWVSDYRVMR